MADIFETVIGMAEPALKTVGRLVEEVQASVQKMINTAVAEAMKANGAGAGTSSSGPATSGATARVRPLRAPGR